MKIASIVEGEGEVAALPVLLRRIQLWRTPHVLADVLPPIRVRRDRFLNRAEEFERHLLLAARKCAEDGWILVLLDADDDCPAELGAEILERIQTCLPHRRASVVLANREYEAWFIAAAQSLHGRRGFTFDQADAVEPETPRDAKRWIRTHMIGNTYGETTDQPAFSALIDLQLAHDGSRSFRKLCYEWSRHVTITVAGRE